MLPSLNYYQDTLFRAANEDYLKLSIVFWSIKSPKMVKSAGQCVSKAKI